MISQETLDRIKQGLNLGELISETVPLKRAGTSLIGLCPFHSEKSPSFNVKDNYYHCFGCGASGNAFSYVMQTQGLSFPEAAQYLADKLGIEVVHTGLSEKSAPKEDTRTLYQLTEVAQDYFLECRKSKEAATYLKQRGLKPETIERFGIGYAPHEWRLLLPRLEAVTKDPEKLIQSGLVRRSAKGELYDAFRGRLMFPIMIDRNRIAGFGGRILPQFESAASGEKVPKYINSPESPIYHKSKLLYGLLQGLDSIRRDKMLYLVEGYMDVVSLAQAGVENAVATCGTAVTDEHVKRIGQLTSRVRVLFDGDDAGKAAAGKTFALFLNSGLDVHAVFLPDQMDPDDLGKKEGANTANFLASQAPMPLIDCYVGLLVSRLGASSIDDLGSAAKGKLAEELARSFKRVTNEIERDELIKRAAFLLRVEPDSFRELSGAVKTKEAVEAPRLQKSSSIVSVADLPRVDQELLIAVMGSREQLIDRLLTNSEVSSLLHTATISFVQEFKIVIGTPASENEKKEKLRELLDRYGSSWVELWKKAFRMAAVPSINLDRMFEDCVRHVRRESLSRTVDELKKQIQHSTIEAEKAELSKQLFGLLQRRDELNQVLRSL